MENLDDDGGDDVDTVGLRKVL